MSRQQASEETSRGKGGYAGPESGSERSDSGLECKPSIEPSLSYSQQIAGQVQGQEGSLPAVQCQTEDGSARIQADEAYIRAMLQRTSVTQILRRDIRCRNGEDRSCPPLKQTERGDNEDLEAANDQATRGASAAHQDCQGAGGQLRRSSPCWRTRHEPIHRTTPMPRLPSFATSADSMTSLDANVPEQLGEGHWEQDDVWLGSSLSEWRVQRAADAARRRSGFIRNRPRVRRRRREEEEQGKESKRQKTSESGKKTMRCSGLFAT